MPGILLDITALIKKTLSESYMQGVADGKDLMRERCAKIAEKMEPDQCCGNIAAAIRCVTIQSHTPSE